MDKGLKEIRQMKIVKRNMNFRILTEYDTKLDEMIAEHNEKFPTDKRSKSDILNNLLGNWFKSNTPAPPDASV